MAQRVVVQPNGKYALFSDVVDDFTLSDADRVEILQFLTDDRRMSPSDAEQKVLRAEQHPHRFTEALTTIRLIHGAAGRAQRKREMSVPVPPKVVPVSKDITVGEMAALLLALPDQNMPLIISTSDGLFRKRFVYTAPCRENADGTGDPHEDYFPTLDIDESEVRREYAIIAGSPQVLRTP